MNLMCRVRRTFFILALLVVISHLNQGYAQVAVSSSLFTFRPGVRPVQNVNVMNGSSVPMYVTIQVQAVKDLGAENTQYEPSEDILVSPKKFSIPPDGSRTVRMLLKNAPVDKERAYRVLVIPQQSDFDASQLQGTKFAKGSLVLKVATGVGMLVFVQPKDVIRKLRVERDSKGVKFINEGNTQVALSGGALCPAGVTLEEGELELVYYGKDSKVVATKGCTEFKGGRIHSGRSREVVAAPGTKVYIASRGDLTESFKTLEVPLNAQN